MRMTKERVRRARDYRWVGIYAVAPYVFQPT